MSADENPMSGKGGASANSPSAPQTIFERNLEAFLEYARARGARVEDGRLAYKGVALTRRIRQKFKRVGFKGSDLTSDIQREIERAGGKQEPVDPKEVWRRLVERNRETLNDEESLRQQPEVFELLLPGKDFEQLWENFARYDVSRRKMQGREGGGKHVQQR